MPRAVVLKKFPKDSLTTLYQVTRYMEDYSREHPGRQVFFDGDRYAVCYIRA